MSEIIVRALTEDEWETYRDVRLQALQESPEAFVASHDEEVGYDEGLWRERMVRSVRLLAEVDDAPVGVVSIGAADDDEQGGQLFGLWVDPQWRGRSVAATLVRRGAETAADRGLTRLHYWVGTDNARAVAFASSFGFRPSDDRRPMRVPTGSAEGEEELAMVLPLGQDRSTA